MCIFQYEITSYWIGLEFLMFFNLYLNDCSFVLIAGDVDFDVGQSRRQEVKKEKKHLKISINIKIS